MAKLYQKSAILAILGSVRAHFKSHNGKIWQEGADLALSLSQAKFGIKNRVYPFLAKLYQKLAILAILTPVSPQF